MKQRLPPEEYYKTLARVPTSGGAIIRNGKGEFLIQKHSYRKEWHIAGGMADEHETPHQAVIREVKEEMGIEISNPRLFCVDFALSKPYDRLLFIFDCGIIDEQAIARIKLQEDEIEAYKFVSREEMLRSLSPILRVRLENSLKAFDEGSCIYLEEGIEPR